MKLEKFFQTRVGDGGDGDGGRIFPEHPSPILHAPKLSGFRTQNAKRRFWNAKLKFQNAISKRYPNMNTDNSKTQPKRSFKTQSTIYKTQPKRTPKRKNAAKTHFQNAKTRVLERKTQNAKRRRAGECGQEVGRAGGRALGRWAGSFFN